MTRLFTDRGLVFIDAAHPDLKGMGKEVFLREIEENSPSTERILKTSKDLEKKDYTVQVHLHEGILNAFYDEQGRQTLRTHQTGFRIGNSRLCA